MACQPLGVPDQMTDGPSGHELETRAAPSLVRRLLAIPEVGILIPLIVLVLFFYVRQPTFLDRENITTILRFMAFVGIIAIGETLLIIVGEIDISVGTVAGLGSIIAAHLMAKAGWPIAASLGVALLMCALIGLLNGYIITRLGVPAFIATIGMLYMARGVKYLVCGGFPISRLPEGIKAFGAQEPLGTNWAFVIFIALVLVGDVILRQTVYGRALYATGGNIEVARLAGINTFWIKMSAFIACSVLSGLAGILLMAQLQSGDTTIGDGWELNVIAGVVLTFMDITRLKHLGDQLQGALNYAQGIVETVREPLMVLDGDLKIQSANRSFYQAFKTTAPETEGRLIYDLGDGQWDIPRLRQLLEEIIPQNAVFDNFEVEHDFPGIGVRTMILNARRLEARPGHPSLILLAMEDVTKLT